MPAVRRDILLARLRHDARVHLATGDGDRADHASARAGGSARWRGGCRQHGAPTLWHVHVDHLNRPIRMTDGAKASVWNAVWTAWGAPHALTGAAALNARFPGQWFQVESGLHYNWHRHYDPSLGRYTQPDPLGFVDGPNVFAYAGSSPANHVDVLGLKRPANSPHCIALREKMSRADAVRQKRLRDYEINARDLPERIGRGERLAQTRRGHRTLIRKSETDIKELENRYREECDDDDDKNNSALKIGAAAAAGTYITYRCLRMLPSLLPPLWPTFLPNLVAP